ncbi:MAG: sulfite exporter TauE/SafE family protein [Cytophagales bacterium]|nr:MAG: sulfite exporter TauE/SafE family protein [Cytophagales bacterium]
MSLFYYTLTFLVSIFAGFVNTLVGSGSLLMIPLLMALGLPAPIANGTNRVAVFIQSVVGVSTFFSHKKIKIGGGWWLIGVATLGAIGGGWLATQLSPATLTELIGVLMVVMLGIIILKPERWLKDSETPQQENNLHLLTWFFMFLSGFYGGFIQGGVGIFLLATLVLQANYPLAKANALKLIIVLVYAAPVLLIFMYYGQIDWSMAAITSTGQALGAYIGAKFATQHKDANLWTYRLLVIILLLAILQFYLPRWLVYFQP